MGGIRIEKMVYVTEHGPEVLAGDIFPRDELVVL